MGGVKLVSRADKTLYKRQISRSRIAPVGGGRQLKKKKARCA
jgi:hypothetical protein